MKRLQSSLKGIFFSFSFSQKDGRFEVVVFNTTAGLMHGNHSADQSMLYKRRGIIS